MNVVTSLFKRPEAPPGPDPALQAIQHDREQRAAEEQARADQLIGLSLRAGSRRRSLAFNDRRSATLGG